MSIFADASALVKLYADEEGSESVRSRRTLVAASVSRVEVPAALWRKERTGDLTSAEARLLVDDFEADWFGTEVRPPRFARVDLGAALLDSAAALVAAHGLRAYDGVQLACALAARAAEPEMRELTAYDTSLRRAAAVEGFSLLPG